MVAAVSFRLGLVTDQDTLDGSFIDLRVVFVQDQNKRFTPDLA